MWRSALSTIPSAVGQPWRARISFSSEPALTPIRTGTLRAAAARTTWRTRSRAPMFPGLSRIPWIPASSAASRTTSAPASASARTCASVAATSAVFVQVIDWTAIGASPPIGTGPMRTCRVRRRAPSEGDLSSTRALIAGTRAAAPPPLLLDAQLLVDDRLEVLERLRPADEPPVDEEGRRPRDPRLLPRLAVGVD